MLYVINSRNRIHNMEGGRDENNNYADSHKKYKFILLHTDISLKLEI